MLAGYHATAEKMTHPVLSTAATLAPFRVLFENMNFSGNFVYDVFDVDQAQPVEIEFDEHFNEYWILSAVDSLFYSADRIENEKDGELVGQLKNKKYFYFRADMVPSCPMYVAVSSDLSKVRSLFCDFEPLNQEVFHLENN